MEGGGGRASEVAWRYGVGEGVARGGILGAGEGGVRGGGREDREGMY